MRLARVEAFAALALFGLVTVAASGCGKKKEEKPIPAPPPRGAASFDELSTGLGIARGLDANLAPSSTEWRRVFVLDDKTAVLAGDIANEAIALVTADAGKTWRSYRAERDAWSSWSVGADATAVLTSGAKEQPKIKNQPPKAPAESVKLFFAAPGAIELTSPWPLLPPEPPPPDPPPKFAPPPVKSYLAIDAIPFVLSSSSAAFVVDRGPRKVSLMFAGPPGSEALPPLDLPPVEKFIPTPYGRAPRLFSIKGRDLLARPMPAPGKPLDAPQKVPNIVALPTLLNELTAPPACEAEGWSFQTITQGPGKMSLLGVSPETTVAVALPQNTVKNTRVGCGVGKVVVQTLDAKENAPTLSICDLEGACVTPKKPPFRSWVEKHEERITTTPTAQGVVAIMSSQAGERWGLYFAQSVEGGATYEVSRVIGEGTSGRGKMDLGALISFGKRTLILLSADVTGTSRRGWYVIISDDGGLTWTAP
ncbi:MAG: hypothetical protein L6Q76_00955 [Polyangiaceae bacterium]|nr:hypothetical protein [Polyangiaceae bacterium]